MTTIKSDKTILNAPAQVVFEKLSNLENLKTLLEKVPADKVPEDKRAMFENLNITADTIEIPGGPAGSITLRVTDKMEPSLIRLEGEGTPLPLSMQLEIEPKTEETSEVQVSLSMEIPAMLKPMISGPVKKIVEQFAQMLKAIPFN